MIEEEERRRKKICDPAQTLHAIGASSGNATATTTNYLVSCPTVGFLLSSDISGDFTRFRPLSRHRYLPFQHDVRMKTRKPKVLYHAVLSRGIVWLISTVAILFVRCYDTSTSISIDHTNYANANGANGMKTFDSIAWSALGQYSRWDAAYFLRIAQVGYEYEKNHAFQPGLPIAINILRFCSGLSYLSGTEGIMTIETSYLIAGALVTNAAFILAAVALYDLSLEVIKNERMAYISCLLFCYNPASIFMSAVYTGSLYACLSFYGMLYLERTSYHNSSKGLRYFAETLMSTLLFAGACATRSNGLLLGMYPVYFVFKDVIWPAVLACFWKVHHHSSHHGISSQSPFKKAIFVMKNAATSLCSVAPYFWSSGTAIDCTVLDVRNS